jgi:dihydroorotate dehydrogenase (fumarate)
MNPDLSTVYLGLDLRTPLVASSSPLTGHLDSLIQLEDAGVGAVVLPSLFEEQIEHDELEIERLLATGADSFSEATGVFPDLLDYNTGPDHYLDSVSRAKESLSIPVLASLNGSTPGGWLRYARLIEEAGADALELNLYSVAADPTRTGAELEAEAVDLVEAVAETVQIPVAVKLSPYWSSLANFAPRLEGAGAAGLVLFNRFYQPDLDLETLEAVPHLVLSTSDELRLPLRWIGLLRGRVACSLGATTGLHTGDDLVKALLVGADAAMTTSALLEHGPVFAAELLDGLRRWLDENEYESVRQLTGSAAQHTGPDPAGFERANYAHTLASYTSRRT